MHCPQCRFENRQDARFCLRCGALLTLTCRQCNTALPSDAVFCDTCGARVSAPPESEEEPGTLPFHQAIQRLVPQQYAERLLASRGQVPSSRRIVTILFADVTGSTALAETLDPEDWTEIMEGAFDVLIGPIYRYEGTLARLMGDAILAFFGAPFSHEDDPERACRAALEIVNGAQQYACQLERERGISGFDVRVGIHTGLVVVGQVGSDMRVEYTAMGDAANLAARMESAAEPGTVLMSEDTHRLVAHLFETEALGPVAVKGKAEPVPAYRVLAATAAPGEARGVSGPESPLVGRDAERGTLEGAIERLAAGVGSIVTVAGEAGIGKSRLVAELRKAATARDPCLQWVEGRSLSYGSSVAYLLWLEVLRALLGVPLDAPPAVVRSALREHLLLLCPDKVDDVYPYLGQMMSLPLDEFETTLQGLEGDQIKANTFSAVEAFVAAAAGEGPLVIVFEDLHWADPTSIELLERCLALTDRAPLLVVCVMRPEREHGCWHIREAASSQYPHRHVDLWLRPLSGGESEALVANLLGIGDLPRELKERVQSHTEGNPFFVEEVIRSLIDRGAIVLDGEGRWQATEDLTRIPIPDTLQGVLMARIDRLEEEAKRVLQMAAVIGRIFLYRILARIAQETRELDRDLVILQREEMIRERARLPELEFIFKHELTREAAYNGLLRKERAAFHRQVAEALEGQFPERVDEQVGLLAHHWERAGDPEKAADYLLRAGDQARQAFAHEEAIDSYQRALVFLKELEDHERTARTLMKLGLTYHHSLDYQASRQAYDEGFILWGQIGEMSRHPTPSPPPHAYRVAGLEWTTLDPGLCTDVGGWIHQLFTGLVELTPRLNVVPEVAHRWEVLEGGRKYVFHLRDDLRWSDGVPLTAGDFEYAWKRALAPHTAGGSPHANLLFDIRGARAYHQGTANREELGVKALDELTLTVELEKPTGYFLQLLTQYITFPVPQHAVEAHGKTWTEPGKIVSNGPFQLAAWERGQSAIFRRNPTYHGRFIGNVEQMEVSFAAEQSSVAWQLYQDNRLDVFSLLSLPPAEWDRVRQRYAGEYLSGPQLITTFVGFDVNHPPFDDPRVRRAFALSADRERLANLVLRGYRFPATGGFVPPGMPGHFPGLGLPYAVEQARQLLAEAGYPNGRGFPASEALTWQGTGTINTAVIDYLQAQWWENLGVEIIGKQLEFREFEDRQSRGTCPIYFSGWVADYPDPDSFLRAAVRNICRGWQDKAYRRLVETARRVMDHEERMELYRQAEEILAQEAPIVPLTHYRVHLLVKPWVKSLSIHPMGMVRVEDVILEPH